MNLDRSMLRDSRYDPRIIDDDGTPVVLEPRRRWVPREELERDLHGFLEANGFVVPRAAFTDLSEGMVFHLWLTLIQGRGVETQYGLLPILLVNLLERLGYDPMGVTGISPKTLIRLLQSWEPAPSLDVHEPTTQ
ncbi:MAG: hypothetical protein V1907_03315 [Candidatus Kerfeldbacteria bacterium]